MKRRIYVSSMVLGAAIMLIAMWVSPLISSPVTAQHNGVFNKIQCRKLTVVDNEGKPAVELYSRGGGGSVEVGNKQGKKRATMSVNAYDTGAVSTWDRNGYRQ